MANNTLKSINKITGTLATVLGGTGAGVAATEIAAGTSDTGNLVVSILTSVTSIIYGLFGIFGKKNAK